MQRTHLQNFFLILTLGVLNALTPFTIDMYLPAFPEIAKDLNVLVSQVALSVSTYFIGFALGQIFYGPLLDRFGRKRPLYFGLSIYILATIGCMSAQSIEALLLFRFLSSLGGCAASVGATAMVRDFFPAQAAAKVFSMLMLVLSASPLLAPSVGSFVVGIANWRMIFGILLIFALLDFLLVFSLPEGHRPDESIKLRLKPILHNFKSVLKSRQFSTYTFAGSFSFAGLFVYVAGSPAIFMDAFQLSAKVYGAIFAFLAVGMIGGGQLNLLMMKKYGVKNIFKMTLMIQVIIGAIFFAGNLMGGFGLFTTIAFLFFLLLCAGVTYPNAAALALAPFEKNIGSASALLGFFQLGIGALTSAGVGLLEAKGSLPTSAVMFISSLIGLGILIFTKKMTENLES